MIRTLETIGTGTLNITVFASSTFFTFARSVSITRSLARTYITIGVGTERGRVGRSAYFLGFKIPHQIIIALRCRLHKHNAIIFEYAICSAILCTSVGTRHGRRIPIWFACLAILFWVQRVEFDVCTRHAIRITYAQVVESVIIGIAYASIGACAGFARHGTMRNGDILNAPAWIVVG